MRVYPLSFCAFVNFISVKYIDAKRQFYCYNLTVKLIFYLNLLSGKRNARMRFVGYIINPVSKSVSKLFFCDGTDLSATATPIGLKVCTMVDDPDNASPLLVSLGVSKCGVKKAFGGPFLASQTPTFAT